MFPKDNNKQKQKAYDTISVIYIFSKIILIGPTTEATNNRHQLSKRYIQYIHKKKSIIINHIDLFTFSLRMIFILFHAKLTGRLS